MRAWILMTIAVASLAASTGGASAEPMTAERAVQIALQRNSRVIQSDASLLDAKSGVWSAYSSVLPNVSASYNWNRNQEFPKDEFLQETFFGGINYEVKTDRSIRTTTAPSISARWNLLDARSWTGLSAARSALGAAQSTRLATRQAVVLETKRRFYDVVGAIHLAHVASQSARLSRDEERRVRALFEVGSVSKSDLLKARVRTSQSELDSILASHRITTARISLSQALGMRESEMSEVDTALVAQRSESLPDMAAVLTEARAGRPDLKAAELEVRAAEADMRSAQFSRLPYVASSASYNLTSKTKSETEAVFRGFPGVPDNTPVSNSVTSESNPDLNLALSVNLDLFAPASIEARIAGGKARVLRARETRDALVRDLEGEVRASVLGYQEALERESLSSRTLESASENLNLVQQKYNVGSATILDLIDAQVQLQRAQSDLVSARAAIRVAEAALDQVRGRGE